MIKNKQYFRTETVENSGNIEGRISKDIILTPAEMLERASMFNIITLPSGRKTGNNPPKILPQSTMTGPPLCAPAT